MRSAAFDPINCTLSLQGQLTEKGSATPVSLEASGVFVFSWSGPNTLPEGHFELSTVLIERTGTGWHVEFEPWNSAALALDCEDLRINGARVEGSGSWYQDDLTGPARR